MIGVEKIKELSIWFQNYVQEFKTGEIEQDKIIDLKYGHSLRVCDEIRDIGEHCGLHQKQLRLAEIMALFHDLGRFSQFKKHKTFADKKSTDHASLAVTIIEGYNLLNDINESDRNLIYTAIRNHNKKEIPYKIFGDELFFSKLLRDADKVDIFKVVTDYFENKNKSTNSTIELDLPDLPEILEENFLDIESGKLIKVENLKTLNDFKLMQISWLFDVNFTRTFEIIKERSYIEKIFNTLPQDDKIVKVKDNIFEYLYKELVD